MLAATGSELRRYEPWLLAPFGCPGSGWTTTVAPTEKGVWLSAWPCPGNLILLAPEEGTGSGLAWLAWLWLYQEPATGGYVDESRSTAEKPARGLAHSPAQMLSLVRAHLSLSIVEVAGVLEVERPTIYAWLAGRSEPQERNRKRLHRLFEVASRWTRLSSSPLGARLRHPDEQGESLVDLLRSGRFEEAEARLDGLARARSIEAEGARPGSIQEVLARHGLKDRIRPSREEIDRLTGKRIAPE